MKRFVIKFISILVLSCSFFGSVKKDLNAQESASPTLAYVAQRNTWSDSEPYQIVFLRDLQTHQDISLSIEDVFVGEITWSTDHQILMVEVTDGVNFYRQSDGQLISSWRPPEIRSGTPTVQWVPNTHQIVSNGYNGIWVYDVDTDLESALIDPYPYSTVNYSPSISPNGEILAFVHEEWSTQHYLMIAPVSILPIEQTNHGIDIYNNFLPGGYKIIVSDQEVPGYACCKYFALPAYRWTNSDEIIYQNLQDQFIKYSPETQNFETLPITDSCAGWWLTSSGELICPVYTSSDYSQTLIKVFDLTGSQLSEFDCPAEIQENFACDYLQLGTDDTLLFNVYRLGILYKLDLNGGLLAKISLTLAPEYFLKSVAW